MGFGGAAVAATTQHATPAAGDSADVTIKVIKVLYAGQQMHVNTFLVSPSQKYMAGMQPDGNLVVLEKIPGGIRTIWAAHTDHHAGAYLRFWKDPGALAVYSKQNKVLWKAGEKGGKAAGLIMQDDGNLVLYTAAKKAVWSSKFH